MDRRLIAYMVLLARLKFFAARVWPCSGEYFIGDVIKALGVVAFLFGADFFTDKPSVNAHIWGTRELYYQSFFWDFFRDNQIDPPSVLADIGFRPNVEKTDKFPEVLTNPQRPDIEYIREVLQNEDYSPYGMVGERTRQLEKHFESSRFTKYVYGSPDRGFLLTNELLNELLCCVESEGSREDYYTVLAALMYGRTYTQQISVKNDGSVDLRNIDVTIPAPLSRLSQRRDGNILEYTVMGDLLYNIEQYSDRITLHIPSLKQGERIGIGLLTRENKLIDADLLCTYKSDRRISIIRVYTWVVAIILIQWLIRWLCNNRKSQRPNNVDQK